MTLAGARAGAARKNRFDERAGVGGRRRLGWRAADRTVGPDVGLWRHTARPVRLLRAARARARAPRGRQLFFLGVSVTAACPVVIKITNRVPVIYSRGDAQEYP